MEPNREVMEVIGIWELQITLIWKTPEQVYSSGEVYSRDESSLMMPLTFCLRIWENAIRQIILHQERNRRL